MLVIAVAAVSAAFYSLATALKHSSAGQAPQIVTGRPAELIAFVRAMLGDRRWVLGVGADVIGLTLQVAALRLGGVIVVQLVLATTVLFALLIAHALAGTRVSRAEVVLGVLLVGSIAGFLLASGAADAVPDEADRLPAALGAATVVAAVATLVTLARRGHRPGVRSRRAASLLGAAVGATYAGAAALMKSATTIAAGHGPVALLTSWQIYVVLVTGGLGLVLTQLAFQAGPLSASLPVIATTNPLVALVLGVVVFDEQLRSDPLSVTLSVVSFVVLAVCVTLLSRVRAGEHEGWRDEEGGRRGAEPDPGPVVG